MLWTIELSPNAEKELAELPRDHQHQIASAIERMHENPFQGNVKPLKDKQWKGHYRKMVGRYRLIFIPYHPERRIEISAVRLRSEKTYH